MDESAEYEESAEEIGGEISYKRRKDSITTKGIYLEIDLLLLVLTRLRKKARSFLVGSNVDNLGNWDDIVYKYWFKDKKQDREKLLFVQTKHKQTPEKWQVNLKNFTNEPFDLTKFFKSYMLIKNHFITKRDNPIFNGDFSNCSFIIYTNMFLEEEFLNERLIALLDDEDSLRTGEEGNTYSFDITANCNHDLIDTIKDKFLFIAAKSIKELIESQKPEFPRDELLQTYHVCIFQNIFETIRSEDSCRLVRIKKSFLQNENKDPILEKLLEEVLKGNTVRDRKIQKLLDKEIQLHPHFGNVDPIIRNKKELAFKMANLFGNSKYVKINQNDLYNLIGNLLVSDDGKNILKFTNAPLTGDVKEFFQMFVKEINDRGMDKDDLQQYKIETDYLTFFDEDVLKESIRQFLEQLKIMPRQLTEKELEQRVREELDEDYKFTETRENVRKMWENDEPYYLSKHNCNDIFHKKIMFDVKSVVETFTGRKRLLEQLHDSLRVDRKSNYVTCVCGIAGIGKTELVKKYIETNRKCYENVLWFDAKDSEVFYEGLRRLAQDRLNIKITNADGLKKDIKSTVEEILNAMKNQKTLFVFDNAQFLRHQFKEDKTVELFLDSLEARTSCFNFVITSRNQNWGNIAVVQMCDLLKTESIELIKKFNLKVTDDEDDERVISDLAEYSDNTPLALQLAADYIKQKDVYIKNVNSEESFTIKKYLSNPKGIMQLLTHRFQSQSDVLYSQNYSENFKNDLLYLDKFEDKNVSETLKVLSLYDSKNIPVDILLDSGDLDEMKVGEIISNLKERSLVQTNRGMLNLSKLLQKTIHSMLINKDKEIFNKAFDKALIFMKACLSHQSITYKNVVQVLLLHVEALLEQVNQTTTLASSISTNLKDVIDMSEIKYKLLGDDKKRTNLLELYLSLIERHLICGDESVNVEKKLGESYLLVGDADKAALKLERMLELNPVDKDILILLTRTYWAIGSFLKAESYINRILDNNVYLSVSENTAAVCVYSAGNKLSLGKLMEAKDLLHGALDIFRNKSLVNVDHALCLRHLGSYYLLSGSIKEALLYYEQSLEVYQNLYGYENHKYITVLTNIGCIYFELEKMDEAQNVLELALLMNEEFYGLDHRHLSGNLSFLGDVYLEKNDVTKAKLLYERSFEIDKKFCNSDDFRIGIDLRKLSELQMKCGNKLKAKEYVEEGLQIHQKIFGSDHVYTIPTYLTKGEICLELEQTKEAEKSLLQALRICEKFYTLDHYKAIDILLALGELYDKLHSVKKKCYVEQAIMLSKKYYAPHSPRMKRAMNLKERDVEDDG